MSDVVRLVATVALVATGYGYVALALNIAYDVYRARHAPSPDSGDQPESQIFNTDSADASILVRYGYCKVDNPVIVFRDRSTKIGLLEVSRPWIWLIAVIGEGEIGSVEACYLDGVNVLDPKFGAAIVDVEVLTGADIQSGLLLNFRPDKFTTNDIGAGVAYAVFMLQENSIAFPGREPKVTFDIRGKKVKDPRTGQTKFSPNPALHIRDYATNTRYGRSIPEAAIVDAEIIAEANYFEERVALPSSTTITADAASDVLTLPSAQTLPTGYALMFSTTGALPGGLAVGTVYYWISLTSTTGKVATTPDNANIGTAIDITTAGTGVQTMTRVAPFSADPVFDHLIFTDDGPFDNGDGVQVVAATGGTLPAGLAAATTYYWIRGAGLSITVSANRQFPNGRPRELRPERVGRVASTYQNAIDGIAIDITDAGSGTLAVVHIDQPRYACSGALDPADNPIDNFAKLRSSCRSWFFESAGQYHLIADKVRAPEGPDITPDNLVGAWSIDMGDEDTHFNRVEANFTNSLTGGGDVAASDNATERAADGGKQMLGTLDLPMTPNPYMAERLAQLQRRASRLGIQISGRVNAQGLELLPGDVKQVSHPTPGWVNKLFRVARVGPRSDDEVDIELIEYADSAYTLDPQAPTVIPSRTNLEGTFSLSGTPPPNVTGLEVFTP